MSPVFDEESSHFGPELAEVVVQTKATNHVQHQAPTMKHLSHLAPFGPVFLDHLTKYRWKALQSNRGQGQIHRRNVLFLSIKEEVCLHQ